jgi:hypothetical protein
MGATCYLLEYRLLLWRRSGKEVEGDRIWKNLRHFSGWMCAGCVAGVVSFSLLSRGRSLVYELRTNSPDITRRRSYELLAQMLRHFLSFDFFYSLHLLCAIYALNMLLRRVSDHASHSYYNIARDHVDPLRTSTQNLKIFDCRDYFGQYALYYWARSVSKLATLLCVLNILARVTGIGFTSQKSQLFDQAAAATDAQGGDTEVSLSFLQRAVSPEVHTGTFTSNAVGSVFEATLLVFVAVAFLLFFIIVIVMFRRVELKLELLIQEMRLRSDQGTAFLPFEFLPRPADGSDTQTEMPIAYVRRYLQDIQSSSAAQRKRFLFCLVWCMTALTVLTSNAVFVAFASFYTSRTPQCGQCDASCQPVRMLMLEWHTHTPELLPLVVSLSTALPLMFSLWLMTTPEDRALLMHPSRFRTHNIIMNPVESTREAQLKAERIRMGINLL